MSLQVIYDISYYAYIYIRIAPKDVLLRADKKK